jgi:hypothetical protein
MKKVFQKLLLLSIVGSIGFLYSCGEDEEPTPSAAPTISVSASTPAGALADGGEVVTSTTVTVTAKVTAEGGFNAVTIKNGATSDTYTRNDLSLEAGATSATAEWEITVTDIGTVSLTFEAVDDENQTGTASFSIVVVEPPSPPAKIQSAVLLSAPLGAVGGVFSSKTFYSISENKTYSRNDVESTTASVSPLIDFGYYYGASDMSSLSAPDEYPIWDLGAAGWGTLNETILELTNITAAEYLEIVTVADMTAVLDEIDLTSSNGTVTNLEEGNVLIFETAEGEQGLILVGAITGTDGSDGTITLEIKLEAAE